jgi:hypothetical protein
MSSSGTVLEEARRLPPKKQRELAETLLAENRQSPASGYGGAL